MKSYVIRATQIARQRGLRGMVAHCLRYVAYKLETVSVPILTNFQPSLDISVDSQIRQAGRLNEIGAVLARTIPEGTNPVIKVPTTVGVGVPADPIKFDKVAVIAHVFYPELMRAFLKLLKNVPVPMGLFVSTDTEEKRQAVLQAVAADPDSNYLEFEVRIVPNKGRDIAPKLIGFRDVYQRYPAFLHLHSKKSLHAGDLYEGWRDYLLNSLIGTREIAQSNLAILSREDVGVVYPEHASYIKPVVNWGYDFELASKLLRRIGVTLDSYDILEFPSGSMYWGRSDAMSKLLSLELSFEDFPDEAGQVDGTLAHAIERSLLFFVERSGYNWVRITTDEQTSAKPEITDAPLFRPISLSSQDFVPGTARGAMETARITTIRGREDKRRLNLLVPTLNSAQIFGGISTALKVFSELASQCSDYDLRVLVTDAPVIEQLPSILGGYEVQKLGAETRCSRVVVDCTDRSHNALEITSEDTFVATAWWTALNAFRIQENQKALFGSAARVIYLIQDFEPGFYGWSTRYALADSTYRRPEDTVSVFNSEELEKYFSKHYDFPRKCVLPYTPNAQIETGLKLVPRERIILFYSRPSAVRNCFEIGIDGLSLWTRRNPIKAAAWRIACIGETFPAHLTDGLVNVDITGKMPLDVYAGLLSKASIGISLMISPHPSYPPLEMAFAGIRTITNKYDSKDISLRSANILSLNEVSPESVANALEIEVERAENSIGKLLPVKSTVKDIETSAPIFSAHLTIQLSQR